MAGEMHTPGPWTLTHIAGSNFAVQRFEVRGMLGGTPNGDAHRSYRPPATGL